MKESALLRLIDKYLGVLICFLLSLTRRTRARTDIRKVLFIELFEMGAAVMAYPSLRYVREKYPHAEIFVLTAKSNQESWEILNILSPGSVCALDGRNFFSFAISLFQQIVALRRKNIDLVIDFEKFTRIAAIFSTLIRPARTAGFYRYEYEGLYRGNLLDVRCAFNQNSHIAKNFLALTKSALDDAQHFPNYKGEIATSELGLPRYQSDSNIKARLEKRLVALYSGYRGERLLVVAPDVGANLAVRNYPLPQLRKVLSELLARYPELCVVIVGTPEHETACATLQKLVSHERCINFCSQTESIAELTELLAMSTLFLGNDNGPAHFASLTETKILALFSTDSPYMYGPLGNCVVLYTFFHCSPCISALNHKRTRCDNNLCLQTLQPDQVIRMAASLIDGTLSAPQTINGVQRYI